jgi:predicted Zn-dependent protease
MESLRHLCRGTLKPFDLIVMDEIESILSHFSSETMKNNAENIFELLKTMVMSDKTKIIALDADIGSRSVDYFKHIDSNFKIITFSLAPISLFGLGWLIYRKIKK